MLLVVKTVTRESYEGYGARGVRFSPSGVVGDLTDGGRVSTYHSEHGSPRLGVSIQPKRI